MHPYHNLLNMSTDQVCPWSSLVRPSSGQGTWAERYSSIFMRKNSDVKLQFPRYLWEYVRPILTHIAQVPLFHVRFWWHLDVIFSDCVCSCVVGPDWPHASGRIFAYWYGLQSWLSVSLPQLAAQLQCTSLLWWDGDLLWDGDGGRNPLTVSLAEEEPKCQEWEYHVRTTALTSQPGQQEASSIAC